jgi:hypothetical protein
MYGYLLKNLVMIFSTRKEIPNRQLILFARYEGLGPDGQCA